MLQYCKRTISYQLVGRIQNGAISIKEWRITKHQNEQAPQMEKHRRVETQKRKNTPENSPSHIRQKRHTRSQTVVAQIYTVY